MERQQLLATLAKLDAELAGAGAADAKNRATLEAMRAEVQRALVQSGPALAEQQQSLGEQLRDAIPRFESTHPAMTMAMAEVVDILNRMGL